MTEICETVVVKGEKGDPLIINKSDFDKNKHELYKKEPKKPSAKKPSAKKPSIIEKDGKFVIIDGEGEQISEEVFATEADAKVMLDLLAGK